MQLKVKRGHDARDIERMVGYIDMYGVEHEGDDVPRLLYYEQSGWTLWFTFERDGEVVLTSAAVTAAVAERLLGSTAN
jgi:hypothetical protein